MRRLLNVLYVTSEDVYLSLDGENIVVKRDADIIGRYPLHTLEGIITFSYAGASPALMGVCAQKGISLSFCTQNGRFLARICGESRGNVLLRRTQYRVADDEAASGRIASMMLFGKLYNCRWNIERTIRDHSIRVNESSLRSASSALKSSLYKVKSSEYLSQLRGLEGDAASVYFSVFDEMILRNKDTFRFNNRSRRPPLDNVNALLSFTYMLLTSSCAHALEAVGLDSYVGFLHRDRPGRKSLALDLMEELRPCFADRFVITLINNRIVQPDGFEKQADGAILLTDECRKRVLQAWQEKKRTMITHPFVGEKMPWGLVPFIQAQLLSRYLRGDTDAYPPFLWK